MLFVAVARAEPPAGAKASGERQVCGELTTQDGVRVLRVWGTLSDRGYAHGYLLAPDVIKLLNGYLSDQEGAGRIRQYEAQLLQLGFLMKIEPRYEKELHGLFDGISARLKGKIEVPALGRPLTYADVMAINCIPDASRMGCSSFAAWGARTQDGKTISGRNLDWNTIEALRGTQIIVVQSPRKTAAGWVSITWPGYIGCLTGMNAKGVTVSMHDVWCGPPKVLGGFTPRGFALRAAIEGAGEASPDKDVSEILRERLCGVGNNIPVSWPSHPDANASAVMEYDGRMAKDGGVTVRSPSGNDGWQGCTNHYRQRAEPTTCDRYEKIEKRFESLNKNGKRLDVAGAFDILKSVAMPRGRIVTYQMVVFEPNDLRMDVALLTRDKPATEVKPIVFDVKQLLKSPSTVVGQAR